MGCMTKQQFLSPTDLKREQVPIPECGPEAYVVVQAIGAKDLFDLNNQQGEQGKSTNLDFAFDLFSRSLTDDKGNRLFADKADAREHFNLSPGMVDSLVETICRVSGLRTAEKN